MKRLICSLICAMCVIGASLSWADEKPPTTNPSTRPAPKELSEQSIKAMGWLAENQLPNGAWGQGDESQAMGGGAALKSEPNVADTCMAVMALERAGSTPKEGKFKDNVLKATAYVCSQIEAADVKSLYITDLHTTRTQQKLGTYIDTFMAAQMLSEMRNKMPDEASNKRVSAALDKVLNKIETNQKDNGQWVNAGWAPALAQAEASKAINIAVQNGAHVDEKVRENAESYARAAYANPNPAAASGGAGYSVAGGAITVAGDAGVPLYSSGGEIAAMRASDTTNSGMRAQFEIVLANPTTQPASVVKDAKDQLARMDANAADLKNAEAAVVAKMNDKQFIAGFGSNGGEEFLSYLNIGESLFADGGENWSKWDASITDSLNRVQNADGSWSGSHCITGRTFCTSAALMVLTIDRAPSELAGKIHDPHKHS